MKGKKLKFKTEIFLLSLAIILYFVSAFCYSYEVGSEGIPSAMNYPYKGYAIPLAVAASLLLVLAALLYLKRK